MDNPVALDETHPGWRHLVPTEKRRFMKNKGKMEDGKDLTAPEDNDQEEMKQVIKNGRELDENHPGYDHLNPEQQAQFSKIRGLQNAGKRVTPEEEEEKGKLDDIMLNGEPIDQYHRGWKGLDPYQKKRFHNLKEQKDDTALSPNQKKEFDALRTAISPSVFSTDLAAALKNLARKEKNQGLPTEA